MHETITVKKYRMHPLVTVLLGILGVCLFFIFREVVYRYQLAKALNELSSGGKAGYVILCFFIFLLCMTLVSYSFSDGVKWILDHERFIAIRKSSMEDQTAVRFYQAYKKRVRRINILNQAIMELLLAILIMIFIVKGGSADQYILLVWLVCILSALNPLSRSAKKKEDANRERILLEDCDPLLYFDIFEMFRLDAESRLMRNSIRIKQAIACFYLQDYFEMNRKLDQLEGKLMVIQEAQKILLQGLAALDLQQPEKFRACSDALARLETAPGTLTVTRNYLQEVRRDWQGRIDLSGPEPERALPYIQDELRKGKHPVFWMDFTFQLAWVELSQGKKDRARENLQLVAERAGTMAIREKAKQLLNDPEADLKTNKYC